MHRINTTMFLMLVIKAFNILEGCYFTWQIWVHLFGSRFEIRFSHNYKMVENNLVLHEYYVF